MTQAPPPIFRSLLAGLLQDQSDRLRDMNGVPGCELARNLNTMARQLIQDGLGHDDDISAAWHICAQQEYLYGHCQALDYSKMLAVGRHLMGVLNAAY